MVMTFHYGPRSMVCIVHTEGVMQDKNDDACGD